MNRREERIAAAIQDLACESKLDPKLVCVAIVSFVSSFIALYIVPVEHQLIPAVAAGISSLAFCYIASEDSLRIRHYARAPKIKIRR